MMERFQTGLREVSLAVMEIRLFYFGSSGFSVEEY
jgi:hypothetical protein